MSDDFGTVSVRRGERSREIEVLRQHYRTHRDVLVRLIGEAPTEHLAAEYQRLIADIDSSLRKLDELEGRTPAAPAPAAVPPPPPSDTQRVRTSPGQRPLVMTPSTAAAEPALAAERYDVPPTSTPSSARALLIILAGLVVLAAIGWLVWRASSQRRTSQRPVVEQTTSAAPSSTAPADTGTVTPAVTPAPVPAAAVSLKVTPALQDYGIIRRGTRAVRQFEAINSGATPLTIDVARSNCRCLYYDYNKKVPANGHETITVTVDGARAKSSTVDEQIAVKVKEDPNATATIAVRATIK